MIGVVIDDRLRITLSQLLDSAVSKDYCRIGCVGKKSVLYEDGADTEFRTPCGYTVVIGKNSQRGSLQSHCFSEFQ